MIYHICQYRSCVNPDHLIAGNHASNPFIPNVEKRFWDKVDIKSPDECWPWRASTDKSGYGIFRYQGQMVHANRVVWELTTGSSPKERLVCHTCDNPICVNPTHLFIGTHLDNSNDKINKGRDYHPEGEDHPRSKLSQDDIRTIRALAKAGMSQSKIGKQFGIDQTHAGNIINHKNWKHVK